MLRASLGCLVSVAVVGAFFGGCAEAEVVCGDDLRASIETCDGSDLAGSTCQSLGFDAGELGCKSDCSFDLAGCFDEPDPEPDCGDGAIDGEEECDGDDLGVESCATLGFDAGELACSATCTFDDSGCELSMGRCGDGAIDAGEACDGTNLDGASCDSLGFAEGALACTAECTFDTTDCSGGSVNCGDGQLSAGESCDADELGAQTCVTLGFASGELACSDECTFDTAACSDCGDGVQAMTEQCDGADPDGASCQSLGFDGGTLDCATDCTFDESACTFLSCGDGMITGNEECDGVALDGATCQSLGFDAGTLACDSNCTFETTSCAECGDGEKELTEACDGSDFGSTTCASLSTPMQPFNAGPLSCTPACAIDTSACTNFTVGFCRLQFPTTITAAAGSSVAVYGRVYVQGLTDQSPTNNLSPVVRGQLGYGPDGSTPTQPSWTWLPATPNGGYNGATFGEPNNDEYLVSFVLPAAGTFDYAFRFTADDGATWLACDGGDPGSSDGYTAATAGQLTSQ
jgi:hypothetical protein